MPIDINQLTDEELKQSTKNREQIRVKYPGITALNFEHILEIILEEVVGWDLTKKLCT